jgi:hypothetical protein
VPNPAVFDPVVLKYNPEPKGYFMGSIPEKCQERKVANSSLTRWWCKMVCGGGTGGKLCEPWCIVAERFGSWTLLITLVFPAVVFIILLWQALKGAF